MPIYEFSTDFTGVPKARPEAPAQYPIAAQQLSHAQGPAPSPVPAKQGRTTIASGEPQLAFPEDIEEFLMPGFRSLDESMLMYWSGLRCPTKDSYRFLRVKITGQDKSVLIWREDLLNGRARLPVAALSRTKADWNKEKFSPAYLPMAIRYPNRRGNVAALVYRPTPWLVNYTLKIWAEHKRDAEYALHQIMTRFNPLAEFRMSDGHLQGVLTMRYGGMADNSDKEATFEQHRLIVHEHNIIAEAWLPLPERLIPTVLETIVSIRDYRGNLLGTFLEQNRPITIAPLTINVSDNIQVDDVIEEAERVFDITVQDSTAVTDVTGTEPTVVVSLSLDPPPGFGLFSFRPLSTPLPRGGSQGSYVLMSLDVNRLYDNTNNPLGLPQAGFGGGNFVINYDPGTFDVVTDVQLGVLPDDASYSTGNGWAVFVSSSPGYASIAVQGPNFVTTTGGGSLLVLNFPILSNAPTGPALINLAIDTGGGPPETFVTDGMDAVIGGGYRYTLYPLDNSAVSVGMVSIVSSTLPNITDATTAGESIDVEISTPISLEDDTTVGEDFAILIPDCFVITQDNTATTDGFVIQIFVSQIASGDATTATDNPVIQIATTVGAQDAVTPIESISTILLAQVAIQDSTSVSDSLAVIVPIEALAHENTTASDHRTLGITTGTNVQDGTALSENFSSSVVSLAQAQDNPTATESLALYVSTAISVSDSTAATEIAIADVLSQGEVSAHEITTVTETVVAAINPNFTSVQDNTTVTDSLTISVFSFISAQDSTAVTEAINAKLTVFASAQDSTTVTETFAAGNISVISVHDNTTATESLAVTANILVVAQENTTATTSPTLGLPVPVTVQENTTATASPNVCLASLMSVHDNTTATDSSRGFVVITIATSDVATASELTTVSPPYTIATHFVVGGPGSVLVNNGFLFNVVAVDATDSVVESYSGMVTFSSSDNLAVLPAPTTLVSGVGGFSATLNSIGNQPYTAQTLTATDNNTSGITGLITGTSQSIFVSAQVLVTIPSIPSPPPGQGNAGGFILVPIIVNCLLDTVYNPLGSPQSGIAGATLVVYYDQNVFDVVSSVQLGTMADPNYNSGNGWGVSVSSSPGYVSVTVQGATYLTTTGGGTLVVLNMPILLGAPLGSTLLDLAADTGGSGNPPTTGVNDGADNVLGGGFGYLLQPNPNANGIAGPVDNYSDVQVIEFGGTPTGGTFTLVLGSQTTSPITYVADQSTLQANVQAALDALPGVGSGNTAVSAGSTTNVSVEFQGIFMGQSAAQIGLLVANSSLTGTNPTITVTDAGLIYDFNYDDPCDGIIFITP